MAGYKRENVNVDFRTAANARNVMGALHAAGKVGAWNDRAVFGKVYVRYQDVATRVWRDLKVYDARAFGVAA